MSAPMALSPLYQVLGIVLIFTIGVYSYDSLFTPDQDNQVILTGKHDITENIIVGKNKTLQLKPGVEMNFLPGTGLVIEGTLIVEGTADEVVKFDFLPTIQCTINCSKNGTCSSTFNKRYSDLFESPFYTQDLYWKVEWLLDNETQISSTTPGQDEQIFSSGDNEENMSGEGQIRLEDTEDDAIKHDNLSKRLDYDAIKHDFESQCSIVETCTHCPEEKWNGIHLKPGSKSQLSHVIINNGGNQTGTDQGSILAENSRGNWSHVRVQRSSSHGIRITGSGSVVTMNDVVLINNTGDGLIFDKVPNSLNISGVTAKGNDNGINIDWTPDEGLFRMICDVTKSNFLLDEFPLRMHFKTPYGDDPTPTCNKTFTTLEPGHVLLHVWVDLGDSYDLKITDGASFKSPVIYRGGEAINYISSTSSSMSFNFKAEISTTGGWFLLYSIPKGSERNTFSRLTLESNRKAGLVILGGILPVNISTLISRRNQDGLVLKKRSLSINITNSTVQNNEYNGIMEKESCKGDSSLYLGNSEVSGNGDRGLYIDRTNCADANIGPPNLVVFNSQFVGNVKRGLELTPECKVNVKLNSLLIESNDIGVLLDINKADTGSRFLLFNNTIAKNNEDGLRISGLDFTFVNITNNRFQGNKKTALRLIPRAMDRKKDIDMTKLDFTDNHLVDNPYSIFHERNDEKISWPIFWNIRDNSFSGSGNAIDLKDHGIFEKNTITSLNVERLLPVIQIEDGKYDMLNCAISFHNNKFTDVNNSSSILRLQSSCENITVLKNEFINNEVIFDLIDIEGTGISKNSIQFDGNKVSHNSAQMTCFKTVVVRFHGSRNVSGHLNVFKNNSLTYLMAATSWTMSSALNWDFDRNYWETHDNSIINSRLYDSWDTTNVPRVVIEPFYIDASLTKTTETFEPPKALSDSNHLCGRLDESLALREGEEYFVTDNFFIPHGLTLTVKKGVTLFIQPSKKIQVEGRLIMEGTEDDKINVLPGNPSLSPGSTCELFELRRNNETEVLEIRGEKWLTLRVNHWNMKNANVACKQLGYSRASDTKIYDLKGEVTSHALWFNCRGDENQLGECQSYKMVGDCGYGARVYCVEEMTIIAFSSKDDNEVSKLDHVILASLSGLLVTGTPPTLSNTNVINGTSGVTYIGSGWRNVDVSMDNVHFKQIHKSAVSFHDIASNVTLNKISMDEVTWNGLHFSPPEYDRESNLDTDLPLSSFTFCDLEPTFRLKKHERYHFVNSAAQYLSKCQRVFETDAGLIIALRIQFNGRGTESDGAIIYNGRSTDPNQGHTEYPDKKIGIYYYSKENVMTVQLTGPEDHIQFAMVIAVEREKRECDFDRWFCGWSNYEDEHKVELGRWSLSFNHRDEGRYRFGIDRDRSGGGKYVYAGSLEEGKCPHSYLSETAILVGPTLHRDLHICEIRFFYNINNLDNYGNKLKLYVEVGDRHQFIWESYGKRTEGWEEARVGFLLPDIATATYRLLFYAEYLYYCEIVGIDDISLVSCQIETSFVSITDARFTNVHGHSITMRNHRMDRHHVIRIERSSISGPEVMIPWPEDGPQPNKVAIDMNLQYDDLLISHTIFKGFLEGAVSIHLESRHTEWDVATSFVERRNATIRMIQNSFEKCKCDEMIRVESTNGDSVFLERNTFSNNTVYGSLVDLTGCNVYISHNLILNNNASSILKFSSEQNRPLLHEVYNNTLWHNIARNATIIPDIQHLELSRNVIYNPDTEYEISTSTNVFDQRLNCGENWWAFEDKDEFVKKRIRVENSVGSSFVDFLPFYYDPDAILPYWRYGACPFGWVLQHSNCLLVRGGAASFSDAKQICSEFAATLLSEELIKKDVGAIQEMISFQDIDGSVRFSDTWIRNSQTSADQVQLCPTFDYSKKAVINAQCGELKPFICQSAFISACKIDCSDSYDGYCDELGLQDYDCPLDWFY